MFTSLLGNSDLCQWAPWALAQGLMGSRLCSCPVPATFFFPWTSCMVRAKLHLLTSGFRMGKDQRQCKLKCAFQTFVCPVEGQKGSRVMGATTLSLPQCMWWAHQSPRKLQGKTKSVVRVQSATAKHLSCKSQVYQFLKHHPVWKQCWRKLSEGLWRQDFPAGVTLADGCCCGLSFPCTGNGLGTARMGWAALCWTSSPFPATLIHMLSIPSLFILLNQDQKWADFPHPPVLLHVPGMRISFLKTHTFVKKAVAVAGDVCAVFTVFSFTKP